MKSRLLTWSMVAMTALACSACSSGDNYDQGGAASAPPSSSSTGGAPTMSPSPGYQTSPQSTGPGGPVTTPDNGNYQNYRNSR